MVKDGAETDVDCGGPACPKCQDGRKCAVTNDCNASHCQSGICCTVGSNRDSDSLDDCTEYTDNNAWTDPDIFNGLKGVVLPPCTGTLGSLSCNSQDTVPEVRACAAKTVAEQADQWAGWSWPSVSETDVCAASHGFSPNWSASCGTKNWAVYYTGKMTLPVAGRYCFKMAASSTSTTSCGTLVLNGDTGNSLVTTDGGNTVCINAQSATTAAVELYYQQSTGVGVVTTYGFDVIWCYAASGNCNPSNLSKPNTLVPQILRNK
jgi:hypothetical protein